MSQKIKNPNEKSSGFLVGIIALVVIVLAVIGAVLYMGRNQPMEGLPNDDVDFNVAVDGDVIRLSSDKAGDDAVVAQVFEDFSCGYCGEMATGGHSDELKALNEGTLVVEQHTLNFLDGTEPGSGKVKQDGHSTKSMAIMREIAKTGDAKLYWNFHAMMMKDQQTAAGWSNEELAERAKSMGADDELVAKITDGIDTAEAKKAAEGNYGTLEKALGKVSSPHVLVDGKDVLDNLGERPLSDWVKAALETKR